MKLIADGATLSGIVAAALNRYQHYSWCVAWAGPSPIFDKLRARRNRIASLVVGTHFYQTHPQFIATFMRHPRVRFVLQPDGIFHPKVYLFWNSRTDWLGIVGSSNFTSAGFSTNSEASSQFDSSEPNAGDLYDQLIRLISNHWESGKQMSEADFERYKLLRRRYRPQLQRIGGRFGTASRKSATEISLFSLSFPRFVQAVQNDEHHDPKKRLDVLAEFRRLFRKYRHFRQMPLVDRKKVAGFFPDGDLPYRYFGSMKGAGRFKHAVLGNNSKITEALDRIPLNGPVNEKHLTRFWNRFMAGFPDGGAKVAVASRLLAMKRPDVFLCIDNANRSALARDFGIAEYRLRNDPMVYWNDVIERIRETDFWNAPRPASGIGQAVWDGRAALVDVLYYRGAIDRGEVRTAELIAEAQPGIRYWLTSVKSEPEQSAIECIKELVGRDRYYAFGRLAHNLRQMKQGDRIAFYAAKHGIVAHATIEEPPSKTPRPDGEIVKEFPWVTILKDPELYLTRPVVIDALLRKQMDAFRERNRRKWEWFVRRNQDLSANDFRLLTRQS